MRIHDVIGNTLGVSERTTSQLALKLLRFATYQHNLRYAHLYQGSPEDIFVVSYPKSGTTWVQMILYQLMTDGSMNISHIDAFSPFLDEMMRSGRSIKDISPPRVIKSHLPYNQIPKGPGRYIYVLRDGKDAAVSFFHQQHSYPRFDAFFKHFIAGDMPYGSWFDHVAQWTKNPKSLKLLVVTYESLIANLKTGVSQIAAFCGLETTTEVIDRAVRNSTFENMRQHEKKFSILRRYSPPAPTFPMIREGKIGGWKGFLDQEMVSSFEALSRRRLPLRVRKMYESSLAPPLEYQHLND